MYNTDTDSQIRETCGCESTDWKREELLTTMRFTDTNLYTIDKQQEYTVQPGNYTQALLTYNGV